MVTTLGWGYFEKLTKQKVMQLQSAADPPKKVAAGERAIQVDGADYTILQLQEKGEPVEIVYADEGTPLISGPAAIMPEAPNPNAGSAVLQLGHEHRVPADELGHGGSCARRMRW